MILGLAALILVSSPTLAKTGADNLNSRIDLALGSGDKVSSVSVPVEALAHDSIIEALGASSAQLRPNDLVRVAQFANDDRRKMLERHHANRHERRAKRRAKRAAKRAAREEARKKRRNRSTKVAAVETRNAENEAVKKRVTTKKRARKKTKKVRVAKRQTKKKVVKTPEIYKRAEVEYASAEPPGTIIIETSTRHLYRVVDDKTAIRYGVAVGREGFAWSGEATIERKVEWPTWTPPKEMIARSPKLKKWAKGQPGGPDNPLGAAALYLFQGEKDTLYRIHGTNAPSSIGHAASSGCIRMFNKDVQELYSQVTHGTKVIVR